jgi:hypothetical protein
LFGKNKSLIPGQTYEIVLLMVLVKYIFYIYIILRSVTVLADEWNYLSISLADSSPFKERC